MNYSNKLAWRRYQRLRREYRAAILKQEELKRPCLQKEVMLAERVEGAQHRLDSFVLTYLLFNECRQRQGVGSTRE